MGTERDLRELPNASPSSWDWLPWLPDHSADTAPANFDLRDIASEHEQSSNEEPSVAEPSPSANQQILSNSSAVSSGDSSQSHAVNAAALLPCPQPTLTDDYSFASDSSAGSLSSVSSFRSSPLRKVRGRKPARRSKGAVEKRRYQCTFCTDRFKTKHDWQRHETSLHLSLENWRCTRFGPTYSKDGGVKCVFCACPEPSEDHFELHRYSACVSQPEQARVFYRKDHIQQHLRYFHRGCAFNESMESWLSSIEPVRSRCGFCDTYMETWSERQNHLAAHFRNNAELKDWEGDRGFDPDIEALVENEIPVFLIHWQRNTMEPFSASRSEHCSRLPVVVCGAEPLPFDGDLPGNADQQISIPSTPYIQESGSMHSPGHVERVLLEFVSEEIRNGRVPSDRQLQSKTSEIMYGPGNEWDHTWADNPQWLAIFRKKAGLISLPLSGGKNAFVGYDAT